MNLLSKITLTLFLAISTLAMLGLAGLVLQIFEIDFDFLHAAQTSIANAVTWQVTFTALISFSAACLLFAVLLKLWKSNPNYYKVTADNSHDVFVTRQSVEALAQALVSNFDGVKSCRSSSKATKQGVTLYCKVVVHSAKVPELATNIQESVKLELEKQLGIKIAKFVTVFA